MRRKPLAKTVQRGYGAEHKRLRARLLAASKPSDPCARCGWPLGADRAAIQLGHTDDRSAYTGLEHRVCNIGASNRRRAKQRQAVEVEPGVWLVGPHASKVRALRQQSRPW